MTTTMITRASRGSLIPLHAAFEDQPKREKTFEEALAIFESIKNPFSEKAIYTARYDEPMDCILGFMLSGQRALDCESLIIFTYYKSYEDNVANRLSTYIWFDHENKNVLFTISKLHEWLNDFGRGISAIDMILVKRIIEGGHDLPSYKEETELEKNKRQKYHTLSRAWGVVQKMRDRARNAESYNKSMKDYGVSWIAHPA